MGSLLLPALLALAAGASVVLQQMLTVLLRTALISTAWAGVVSYAVGLVCMILFALALRDPVPTASMAARLPWWAWGAGLFGALYIGLAMLLIPQIGAATFLALLITGQMLAGLALDHIGFLGLAQRSVDLPRLLGAALLIGGVVLIRR